MREEICPIFDKTDKAGIELEFLKLLVKKMEKIKADKIISKSYNCSELNGHDLIIIIRKKILNKRKKMQTKNELLEKNFSYHSPTLEKQEKYVKLREKAKELAYLITELCPESRERSLAITGIEQSIMWANASVARYP